MKNFCLSILLSIVVLNAIGQPESVLPPILPWKGKSVELISNKNNPWLTPVERSDFVSTPSYEETYQWLKKICDASPVLDLTSIGTSAQGRSIYLITASQDQKFDASSLRNSTKPLLLFQAGIHAGEIDGKDASMMLLRDIAFGRKSYLLEDVNILLIPILNVDGHERSSPYNRVNQRGPSNMGWRTNARNLNLNRDYMKVDTEEIKAVLSVFNQYDPDLYVDLHVTDGADYQYDITYGYSGLSPSIYQWLDTQMRPSVDKKLQQLGHIPGPLVFATNDRDFSAGNSEFAYSPRFSNNYADLRHTPSILVENHSLKPFRQRVLGTYVFLEALIEIAARTRNELSKAIENDRASRSNEIVLSWKQNKQVDTVTFLGIESKILPSKITNSDYVVWTGKPIQQRIPYIRNNTPDIVINRPKAYWIPATYPEVIARLEAHGIKLEKITTARTVDATVYRIGKYQFSRQPFEGHFAIQAEVHEEKRQEVLYPGAVRVVTDQPLGDLAIHLLEPQSPDSFFSWGFFPEIFNRTEYIEEYAIEPLAQQMLKDEKIKAAFEQKKKSDAAFPNNPSLIYEWFYSQSPYVDERYLLYPIAVEK